MTPINVPPSKFDIATANAIADHTDWPIETTGRALTWGADEHVLCALAAGWWLYCHSKGTNREASNHVLLTTVVSAALPHVLKLGFDQTRPDRRTVRGHWRGVEFSGRRKDAFPSGHALHIGAISSAATMLPKRQRNWVWGISAALATTRILVLAHWVTDVAAGLVAGLITERLLRMATGFNPIRTDDRE